MAAGTLHALVFGCCTGRMLGICILALGFDKLVTERLHQHAIQCCCVDFVVEVVERSEDVVWLSQIVALQPMTAQPAL